MEEYKFVSPSRNSNTGVKAFTLPAPLRNGELEKQFTFGPPTLAPDWEETFVEQEKHIVFLNTTITSVLTLLVPNSEISEIYPCRSVPAVKFIALISFATKDVYQHNLLTVPKHC